MTEIQKITEGKVGIIHYTLRDDAGEVLDSSRDGDPMPYLHGAQNIVPGLEQALDGKSVGETFSVKVAPADGYGERSGEPPVAVPLADLPDGIPVGAQLLVQTEQGHHFPVWVERLDAENGYLTADHPLAGQNLNFEIEVVAVREATADEQAHGHPHGLDGTQGHHHH